MPFHSPNLSQRLSKDSVLATNYLDTEDTSVLEQVLYSVYDLNTGWTLSTFRNIKIFFVQIWSVFNLSDRFFPEFKSPIEWLKSSLSEEGDDRETEEVDGDEGVAVLPLTEECIMAMEKEQFLQVMRLLEIAPPGIFIIF